MEAPNGQGGTGRGWPATSAAASAANIDKERLRREDHLRVKHDKLFSDWKILVGPEDWKTHAAGGEGAQRYRLHNLPAKYFGPGVYELGLTQVSDLGTGLSKQRKLKRHGVVVVYLGQADNVRQRLQRYGQTGSHLEGTRSGSVALLINDITEPHKAAYDNAVQSEFAVNGARVPDSLGLFTQVFSRGYSIAFRWARTEDKQTAERVESELLHVFDYPWNTSLNGARRARDIVTKLEMLQCQLGTSLCLRGTLMKNLRKLEYLDRKVGIAVAVRKPLEEGTRKPKLSILLSPVKEAQDGEMRGQSQSVCGVPLEDGSTCCSPPVKGRRRCIVHKGLQVKISTRKVRVKTELTQLGDERTAEPAVLSIRTQVQGKRVEVTDVSEKGAVCGVLEGGGSTCLNRPLQGRKRCAYHKGMHLTKNNPQVLSNRSNATRPEKRSL